MKSLKNLLQKKLSGKGGLQKTSLDEKTIFFVFKKVIQKEFGSLGAENFRASYFSRKTIFIKTQSPAWASELWINKEIIIKKLNKELGEEAIEKIKVQ
ncbi:MAG: DUF721 domain-containing protein [Patescibacteria group bacterium]